jgi:signal transduction histidine kinase
MSHELRTPLNSILGLSETLLEERRGTLNEDQRKFLKIIESSGHHLVDRINDILDLSKIEAGKLDYYPQPVNVDDLCRSSLAFTRAMAAKKAIAVNYVNLSNVVQISADARRLKQVLINLLANPVKFAPERGDVTLQVYTDLEQELIQFMVIDTGIGIAQEDLQKLFQPFSQIDSSMNRQYQGTGRGSHLSKN